MLETSTVVEGDVWGTRPISGAQAAAFAQSMPIASEDRARVTRNLACYPPDMAVRGLFFEGIFRIVDQRLGSVALGQIRRAAGLGEHIVPFRQYPHRDFYKLYYLTVSRLHAGTPFDAGLRRVAQTFFPIFRSSLLGRTMSALMGDEPRTILPLLSKAYNLSVSGNTHTSRMTGERELTWQCRVEPVEWYEHTFTGIIEGTMTPEQRRSLVIDTRTKAVGPAGASYEFVIRW
jgi:uncharacterized protein (TIGR02265 family)